MAHFSDPTERVLTDSEGRLHHLIEPAINEGGQGAVYQTREPNIGVKLLTGQVSSRTVIREVRRLPIEDLVSIAAPLSTIEEQPGYVMVWLRGMVPLGHHRLPPHSRLREITDWYIATGGLRRRLALSAKLAEAIADLHARGLVYVDLSMANVMVSDTGEAAEVRLIDLDNLRTASDRSLSVLTERWSAPELFRRLPPSRYTDSYSLALVTFATLTGYHPFDDGDLVRRTPDGSPERRAAVRGELPSFIDPDDESNSTDRHLFPLEIVMTSKLLAAYRVAFGPGREHVVKRPTAAQWRRLLWDAHDLTVVCPCGFSTYLDHGSCASCDRPFDDIPIAEIRSPDASAPSARIAVSNNFTPLSYRQLPLPSEIRVRHDEVLRMTKHSGFVDLALGAGWSCTHTRLRPNEETLIENDEGTTLLLRMATNAG